MNWDAGTAGGLPRVYSQQFTGTGISLLYFVRGWVLGIRSWTERGKQGKEWSPLLIQPLGQSLSSCGLRDRDQKLMEGFLGICEMGAQRLLCPGPANQVWLRKWRRPFCLFCEDLKTLEQLDIVSLAHTLITAPSTDAMTRLLQAALKTVTSRRGNKSSGGRKQFF